MAQAHQGTAWGYTVPMVNVCVVEVFSGVDGVHVILCRLPVVLLGGNHHRQLLLLSQTYCA